MELPSLFSPQALRSRPRGPADSQPHFLSSASGTPTRSFFLISFFFGPPVSCSGSIFFFSPIPRLRHSLLKGHFFPSSDPFHLLTFLLPCPLLGPLAWCHLVMLPLRNVTRLESCLPPPLDVCPCDYGYGFLPRSCGHWGMAVIDFPVFSYPRNLFLFALLLIS